MLSTVAAGVVGWQVVSGNVAAAWVIAGALSASAIAGASLLPGDAPADQPPAVQPLTGQPGGATALEGTASSQPREGLRWWLLVALLVLSTAAAGVVGWQVMSGALAAAWVIGGALASSVLAGLALVYAKTPGHTADAEVAEQRVQSAGA